MILTKRNLLIATMLFWLTPAVAQNFFVQDQSFTSPAPTVTTSDESFRRVDIFFKNNQSDLDFEYKENLQALDQIKQTLRAIESDPTSRLTEVLVMGTSSPVGNAVSNYQLAMERAENVALYLTFLNGFEDVPITVQSAGEDWDTFTADVKLNYWRENREEIISILDSDISTEQKKDFLMWVENGKAWKYLINNNMSSSRRAVTLLFVTEPCQPQPQPQPCQPQPCPPVQQQDPCAQPASQGYNWKDWVDECPPSQSQPVQTWSTPAPTVREYADYGAFDYYSPMYRVPKVALRTNLLVPALNVGLEVPIGNHWSISTDYYYPWFWPSEKNDKCFELLGFMLEGRYWFGRNRLPEDRLKGHSIGLYAAGGYYDFEKDYRGMQGEFVSAGVDYTFALPLGSRGSVHLEFMVAIGYIGSQGRTYDVFMEGGPLVPDQNIVKFNYVGPTKAAVSLVVPIYSRRDRR